MTTPTRHERIVAALRDLGAASVRELSERLGVSESTVRRDLKALDRDGALVRTYGGAAPAPAAASAAAHEHPFAVEADVDAEAKEAMAEAAAALVPDHGVVLLDIGTTTMRIARRLRGRPVTVLTSSLAVLDVLREDPEVRLVLLGGAVRRNYESLVGSLTLNALQQVSADLAFIGCTGVRPNGHVLDDMAVEAPIKQAMIESAQHAVLLAPPSKFPGTGSLRVCTLERVDTVVTTAAAPEETLRLCESTGGKVILA
ncbi:DeoR/GlpR family DNA-binding transcription regulator [Phaeacidiphilus oryzae]|uniref:DeoR/GlpR family DNA-binding transcription regulator n=1 Tax=Phaeacidiphilus oryzae TaxID=348818 RepID=UPI00055B26E0|nr:DeoR/GlpR family DNA-binding transcription regulator [Phaeacidiphilus oryzae]